jgi:hypothetical protein
VRPISDDSGESVKHTKNQHYVPQLYLRQFSPDRRAKNPQIYSFDKTNQHLNRPSIRNVAAEFQFYELGDHGIEKTFQQIEDQLVGPYRRLLEIERLHDVTAEEAVATAIFLAVQWVRTREHRAMLKSTFVELEKALTERAVACASELFDAAEDTLRQVQVRTMPKLVEQFSAIMLRMKWILCMNRTEMPLWTSDHPVTLHNSLPAVGLQGNRGLACRGIELYFPLSPTRSLCLCDPTDLGPEPTVTVSTDVNHAWYQNDLQVRHSTRFVFGNNADLRLRGRSCPCIRSTPIRNDGEHKCFEPRKKFILSTHQEPWPTRRANVHSWN